MHGAVYLPFASSGMLYKLEFEVEIWHQARNT